MPFQGFTVDDSIDRVGGGKPYLEEGDYLFAVSGIQPSPEDHTGKADYWRWQLRVERGPSSVGRTFPHTGTWAADSQWGNGAILRIVGEEILKILRGRNFTDYKTFGDFTKAVGGKLSGRQIGAVVADDQPYNGRPQSQIVEFYLPEEYDRRAAHRVPVGPPAASASSANGANPEALKAMSDDIFANELRDL